MSDNKDINFALKLEKFKDYGEYVRKQYEILYEKMWSNLNEEHLEPLAKVMLERENIVLKGQSQLIDSIRKHAQKSMVVALNNFWQAYGVSEALISLEMCKEKFEGYEGHNWNINSKTPLERTRPIRMRFKESRARYLQAQLDYQQKELEETLKINTALRQKFLDVKNQRIFIMENLEQQRKIFTHAREEIYRMHNEMLDEEENELLKLLELAEIDDDEDVDDENDEKDGEKKGEEVKVVDEAEGGRKEVMGKEMVEKVKVTEEIDMDLDLSIS